MIFQLPPFLHPTKMGTIVRTASAGICGTTSPVGAGDQQSFCFCRRSEACPTSFHSAADGCPFYYLCRLARIFLNGTRRVFFTARCVQVFFEAKLFPAEYRLSGAMASSGETGNGRCALALGIRAFPERTSPVWTGGTSE